MTVSAELELQSFVLLRLGERRFAVAANQIAELVAPSRVFRFPHRTPKIEGVILRRGRIVPVCDVAEALVGKKLATRRLYLIAVRHYGAQREWVALPVTGECELMGDDVGGIAVHIGARVASLAAASEVLVSSTVKDLVAGSGLRFGDRGSQSLKGVPGEWHIYAVER